MKFTAKVRVSDNMPVSYPEGFRQISFMPDYQDDRNKEWAVATPSLNLMMTVKPEIGELLTKGTTTTLTFDTDDPQD